MNNFRQDFTKIISHLPLDKFEKRTFNLKRFLKNEHLQ